MCYAANKTLQVCHVLHLLARLRFKGPHLLHASLILSWPQALAEAVQEHPASNKHIINQTMKQSCTDRQARNSGDVRMLHSTCVFSYGQQGMHRRYYKGQTADIRIRPSMTSWLAVRELQLHHAPCVLV